MTVKLPYAVMRTVLYENDIHLENVGELARFVKIRRAKKFYSHKLESYRELAVLLGNITRGKLVRMYEKTRRMRLMDRRWSFMTAIENRLDMTLLRTGVANNILMAQQWVRHKKLLVNGEYKNRVAFETRPGDVISIAPKHKAFVANHLSEELQEFFYEIQLTPQLRPVYYKSKGLAVPSRPASQDDDKLRLGLGELTRRIAQVVYNRQKYGISNVVPLTTSHYTQFSIDRKKFNSERNPLRVLPHTAVRMGVPAALEQEMQNSFQRMLIQRADRRKPAAVA